MENCMFQAIFDCFDSSVLGLAMETNMKATFVSIPWIMPIWHILICEGLLSFFNKRNTIYQ